MSTKIDVTRVRPGHYVVSGGKRWQVWRAEPDGPGVRLRLRRPWVFPVERTSLVDFPAGHPAHHPVVLDADQGTCADCGLALAPGLDLGADGGDEAGQWRDLTGRYLCRASDDALHHPVIRRA